MSSAICCSVTSTSAVRVVVMDWTETGASPPTGTRPTMTWRDTRRGKGASGTWRSSVVTVGGQARERAQLSDGSRCGVDRL